MAEHFLTNLHDEGSVDESMALAGQGQARMDNAYRAAIIDKAAILATSFSFSADRTFEEIEEIHEFAKQL